MVECSFTNEVGVGSSPVAITYEIALVNAYEKFFLL